MTPTAVKWITVMLGLWLIMSPFILNITGTGRWNNVLVGVIVAVAGYRFFTTEATA